MVAEAGYGGNLTGRFLHIGSVWQSTQSRASARNVTHQKPFRFHLYTFGYHAQAGADSIDRWHTPLRNGIPLGKTGNPHRRSAHRPDSTQKEGCKKAEIETLLASSNLPLIKYHVYTVKSGDSLYALSKHYEIPVAEIQRVNKLNVNNKNSLFIIFCFFLSV